MILWETFVLNVANFPTRTQKKAVQHVRPVSCHPAQDVALQTAGGPVVAGLEVSEELFFNPISWPASRAQHDDSLSASAEFTSCASLCFGVCSVASFSPAEVIPHPP